MLYNFPTTSDKKEKNIYSFITRSFVIEVNLVCSFTFFSRNALFTENFLSTFDVPA